VRPGTGEPVAGYALRIEDDERAEVADGEPGDLYVCDESAAMGYWCRAEVTRRVFRGPWLRTGDTYVRSPDGYYSYLGRSDDIIKAGGIWVSPPGGGGSVAGAPRRRRGRRGQRAGRRRTGEAGRLRGAGRRCGRLTRTGWSSTAAPAWPRSSDRGGCCC